MWILLKQETVSGSGISWAICKSAPCSRQITTPAPHHYMLAFIHSFIRSPVLLFDIQWPAVPFLEALCAVSCDMSRIPVSQRPSHYRIHVKGGDARRSKNSEANAWHWQPGRWWLNISPLMFPRSPVPQKLSLRSSAPSRLGFRVVGISLGLRRRGVKTGVGYYAPTQGGILK